MTDWIRAGTVEEIQRKGSKVIPGGILVFSHEGVLCAMDNRCPHMGFPLHQGTLCDGILTCHWHHARFDVLSGGTLDPWADDVPTYAVHLVDGQVWVDPRPKQKRTVERHWRRLREGLEQNIPLIIAKSVIALIETGVPEDEIAQFGVQWGTAQRSAGWGPGLTILTAMAGVLPKLDTYGRILALFQGLVHVARDCSGRPPRYLLQPLPDTDISLERLASWYRQCVEVRDTEGAERILLTAIQKGASLRTIADMMLVAATNHFYLDGGHTFDFHNKAFEVLERAEAKRNMIQGSDREDHAPTPPADEEDNGLRERVLTSLLPLLAHPMRSEELQNWRAPVDLVTPLQQTFAELPEILEAAGARAGEGTEVELDEAAFVNQLLSDQPLVTVARITDALRSGVPPVRIAQLVALATAERIARFHVQNDFSDWIAVLHTFTHAHAVHERLLRGSHALVVRAVYHTAMRIYLDRFLNIPSAPAPNADRAAAAGASLHLEELLDLMNKRQLVAEAANWVAHYLNRGGDVDALFNTLGHALLREDAEFHSFQMYEAAVQEYAHWDASPSPLAAHATRPFHFHHQTTKDWS